MTKEKLFTAILASTLALTASAVFGQGSGQNAAQQSAQTKKAKVWTDDNIDSVRSASDLYQVQEAKEAQASAAKQGAAAQTAPPPEPKVEGNLPNIPTPKTVQEADQLIKQQQAQLSSEQEYVEQTKKELATAPDSQKERLGWRIQSRTEVIGRIRAEIAQLQAQKAALEKKAAAAVAAGGNSASGGSGSNQN